MSIAQKKQNRFFGLINRCNEIVAVRITLFVSSIWAFYLFVIFGLTPMIWPNEESVILYWSNFLQLIFLPIITVGAAIMGRDSEQRAQQDHEYITREFNMLRDMIEVMEHNYHLFIQHVAESPSKTPEELRNSAQELAKKMKAPPHLKPR